jgi:hypothetical protein
VPYPFERIKVLWRSAKSYLRIMTTIQEQANNLLQFMESQILCHTDIVLIREMTTGQCGQASCIFVSYHGMKYAVSCRHILKPNSECFTGARRVQTDQIPDGAYNDVPPLKLARQSQPDDLAIFTHDGLRASEIPKVHYAADHLTVNYGAMIKNVRPCSFILGAPGAFTRGTQWKEDGLVYLEADLYTAYGPIVSVTENRIVANFAETELIYLNENSKRMQGFVPTEGARDLSGMSGSGLWVYATNRFHLAGILIGRVKGSDTTSAHLIEFSPIWKVRELLISVLPDQTSITGLA